MGNNTAGFYGKVVEADCECHEGLFFVEVYFMDPIKQNCELIARTPFDTKREAESEMISFVKNSATYFMAERGIDMEQITNSEQHLGQEADRWAEAFMKENNPKLN